MKLKKAISMFLSVLLIIAFPLSASAANGPVDSSADHEGKPSVYAVTPGSSKWASFTTYSQMVDACHIPDEQLAQMSTEELVDAVLDYPFLINLFAFNTYEEGIRSVRDGSDAYRALLRRSDGAQALYVAFYSAVNASGSSQLPVEQLCTAILLTDDAIFGSLPSDAQSLIADQLSSVNISIHVAANDADDAGVNNPSIPLASKKKIL